MSQAELLDELTEEGGLSDLAAYDQFLDEDDLDQEAQLLRELRADAAEGCSSEALLAEETILELDRRLELVGDHYPIVINSTVASLRLDNWKAEPVYSFLAALNARYIWKLDADLKVGARLFERLVVYALRRYWGGDAAHFGWPRDPADFGAFREAFPRIVALMRERLSVRKEELPLAQKDLAVDAIAWRSLDVRPGQTVLLCQCSIGGDWAEKGVPIEKWSTLVNFSVAPTRGLAFPFVPEAVRPLSNVEWLLLCAGVGVPFDRLRLARLLAGVEIEGKLLESISHWTQDLVPHLSRL